LNTSALLEASRTYAQAWNEAFASKLLYLPRELRDLVYDDIWTKEYIRESCDIMVGTLQRTRSDRLPHFVLPQFVGLMIARELVEAWYRLAPGVLKPFNTHCPQDIQTLVDHDAFDIGLNPATVLRELDIGLDIDSFASSSGDFGIDTQPIINGLKHLLKIEMKNGFRLRIQLLQQRVRLNLWKQCFTMLKPTLQAFETESSNVSVTWGYHNEDFWRKPLATYDLTGIIRRYDYDWKETATKWLDLQDNILDEHREYRQEDDREYHPNDFLSSLETFALPRKQLCSCLGCNAVKGDGERDIGCDDMW
jgi:hypothetical protein